MATPHDDLFHGTFQHARHAAGWLLAVLPAAMAGTVNWATLRPAPEKVRGRDLRQSVTDPVFVVELADGTRAFLLFEH